MLANQTVVRMFSEGKTNVRSRHVIARGNALYSYGEWFPLAIRREEASNLKTGQEWVLLNGDRYSVTTSCHQNLTFRYFEEWPRVSFTAIRAAEIDPQCCEIVDWVQDQVEFRDRPGEGADPEEILAWKRFAAPIGAFYGERRSDEGGVIQKWYHRIGSAVLRQDGQDYLCSMDEGSYFVSLLPHLVSSVEKAFAVLKPDEVRQADDAGLPVLRQGEWFFIPVVKKLTKCPKRKFEGQYVLPFRREESNRHVVTRGIQVDGGHFVFGLVRHRTRWGHRSGEHRTLKLPKGVIHEAVRNTSLGDWSANGRVD